MKEIEVKVIEIDKEKIINRLKELKAKKIGEYDIKAIIFDTPDNKFEKQKNIIRLRQKGKSYLTFKGKSKKGFAKECEEIEFEVSDFDLAKLFFEKIGFKSFEIKTKHRISFKLNDVLIEIDEYAEIPVFLEIEAKNEEKIKSVIKLLDLSEKDVRNWGAFELFRHYNKKLLKK
jgi:adenylate cyclase, class 2